MPVLESYAGFLNDEGYSHESFTTRTWLIIQFSRWLHKQRIAIEDLTIRHAESFWRECSRGRTGGPRTLKEFLVWLHGRGIISSQALHACEISDVDSLIEEYSTYLVQERGLAPTSIKVYISLVHRFLDNACPAGRFEINSISAQAIRDFVVQECNRYRTSKAASLLTVAIRSFMRFAQHRGYVEGTMAAAVPSVACWSMASIPRALPLKLVQRVLAKSAQRRTSCGLRDRAILLLLARLGLRAREVMLLELDDLDWPNSCIHVSGKGRQERSLPIPQDVGQAIATYLREGRQASPCRRVFLRARAPWRGLANSHAMCQIVKRALKRARIKSATYGAHQFRHALATSMLRQGASLTEIGQVLRHRDPNTTRLYAKVDLTALRELALPWPGKPL